MMTIITNTAIRVMVMVDGTDRAGLYRLMAWLSPSYPVGAFAYSHGIEQAFADGLLGDEQSLQDWVADLIRHGGGWADAVLFSLAFRADGNDAVGDVNDLAIALAPSLERHLETTAQGTAFFKATLDAWPWDGAEALKVLLGRDIAYPVAVALAARGHRVPLDAALPAFLHGFAANLISAGVRLIPLGQSAGQRALAALEPVIEAAAMRALVTSEDDLGSMAIMSDIAAMRHETLYTRLFRS